MRKAGKSLGTSLAETIISLGLLGVVLIPAMYFSSAYFLGTLAGQREKLFVVHSVSQAMNQMMTELSQARVLLPTSDATHLYFAYYDPIRQQVIKRGYQLSANGTNQKLEKLNYNEGTSSWTTQSPYSKEDSDAISIPAAALFQYCSESNCTEAPERALSVKLNGFTFQRKGAGYTLTLPSDPNFYLASGIVGDLMISETPRELFSMSGTESFGGNANLNLTLLAPKGNLLNNLSFSVPATPVLSVISNPGNNYGSIVSPTTGRVYFNGGGHHYTWHESTGLSTIASSLWAGYSNWPDPGNLAVDPSTDRLFIGSLNGGAFAYTWHPSTGLSTLVSVSGGGSPGMESTAIDSTGRVYMGTYGGFSDKFFWTWHQSTGLSTLVSDGDSPGTYSVEITPYNNRVYFGEFSNTGSLRTWRPSTGISTIISGRPFIGLHRLAADPGSERVYFGEQGPYYYTWEPTTGLSTLVSDGNSPGSSSTIVDPITGRVFFHGGVGNYLTWSTVTGLSTLISGGSTWPGNGKTAVNPSDGRVYFGDGEMPGHIYSWHTTTGLSTLASGIAGTSSFSLKLNASTGRIFWGDGGSNANFYTWHPSSGVSTLISGRPSPGNESTELDVANNRVYFSDGDWWNTGNTYVWSEITGLMTLVSNTTFPGHTSTDVDTVNDRVFFGDNNNFYKWDLPALPVHRANSSGTPTSQTLSLEFLGDQYGASAKDIYDDLYLLNVSDNTLDRFHYNRGEGMYKQTGQLQWSGWAPSISAVAVDQASTKVALLDSGNKQIDVYADRSVSGVPAAPTQLDISATTTPTGLAMNGRTGDYLVLDSALQGGTSVRLFVFDGGTGALEKTIPIDVTAGNLSVDASGESNFKIAYNDQENILYLFAPTLNRIYGLSLSEYL